MTKEEFRKDCLLNIKKLPKHNKLYRDYLVMKNLYKELKKYPKASVLFYYPLDSEVDIRKLLISTRRRQNVYLPFMVEQSFKMVRYRLPLVKKRFNIFEAGNSINRINKIDIAIVPSLGVDSNLQRIGFGKGMYDRFFPTLKNKPYTIFIQSSANVCKESICDSYDISCNLLLFSSKRTFAK